MRYPRGALSDETIRMVDFESVSCSSDDESWTKEPPSESVS